MKRYISLLLAAMLFISLCACGGGGSSGKNDDADDEKAAGAIAFEYDCDSADMYDDAGLYLSYMINSAKVTEGVSVKAGAEINKVLEASHNDAVEYYEEFKESAYSAHVDGSAYAPYSYDYQVIVRHADEGIISLCVTESVYAGGAHGSFGQVAYNFDTGTGKLLSVEDLSDDGDELTQFIVSYIQSSYADTVVNNEPDLSQVSKLLEEGQWYFSYEGLVVFAQQYQIASYAGGMPTFVVPYDELKEHVNKAYLPSARTESGEIVLSDKGDEVAEFPINPDGATFGLSADGTVYDVRVYEAVIQNGYITLKDFVCYRSFMNDGEYISVSRYIPDAYCNIIVFYTDADGVEHSYGVAQSGKDGSIYLDDNWKN